MHVEVSTNVSCYDAPPAIRLAGVANKIELIVLTHKMNEYENKRSSN